jgi:zinc protease
MRTSDRFEIPLPGPPSGIAFPALSRTRLSNGLDVWTMRHSALPVVSFALVLDCGTSIDPPGKHGLASLVASLAAESAGSRDSIALADAIMRIGGDLEVQAGADVTMVSLLTLARHTPAGLDLLADIVMRPQLNAADFDRVRDLRLSRLRQASRVAGTMADRALIAAAFGDHPYSRGSLGTTRTVESMNVDDARAFWKSGWSPAGATLIAVGDLTETELLAEVTRVFGRWTGNPVARAASGAAGDAARGRRHRRASGRRGPGGSASRPCGAASAHARVLRARDVERAAWR